MSALCWFRRLGQSGQRLLPTCDVQVERGRVVSQRVLSQRRHADDPSSLVHVFDPLLSPAQVGVGNGRAVAKVQLDVGSDGVALKRKEEDKKQRNSEINVQVRKVFLSFRQIGRARPSTMRVQPHPSCEQKQFELKPFDVIALTR